MIQKLKTDLWSRRTKSSGARSNEDDLCRYEPAEAIAAVRRLVKKAEEQPSVFGVFFVGLKTASYDVKKSFFSTLYCVEQQKHEFF